MPPAAPSKKVSPILLGLKWQVALAPLARPGSPTEADAIQGLQGPGHHIYNMSRRVIGVDLDEVLGGFVPAIALWHNDTYGTSLSAADFHSYKFSDVWGGSNEDSVVKVECTAVFQRDASFHLAQFVWILRLQHPNSKIACVKRAQCWQLGKCIHC